MTSESWPRKWRGSKVCPSFVFFRVLFVGWFVMKMDYNRCMVFIDVKTNLGSKKIMVFCLILFGWP